MRDRRGVVLVTGDVGFGVDCGGPRWQDDAARLPFVQDMDARGVDVEVTAAPPAGICEKLLRGRAVEGGCGEGPVPVALPAGIGGRPS